MTPVYRIARFARRTVHERRVSPSTLEAYTLDITALSRWAVTHQIDLLELTENDLSHYLNDRTEEGTKALTLARHLSSHRRFFDFLVEEGARATNPALAVRGPEIVREDVPRLEPATVRALLRPTRVARQSPFTAYLQQRDHMIVRMLHGSRLSTSAVRRLRWDEVDSLSSVEQWPSRFHSSWRGSFARPWQESLTALRNCAERADLPQAESEWCFPTSANNPMTRQALCHAVRRWAVSRGIVDILVTPTMIRHAGTEQELAAC